MGWERHGYSSEGYTPISTYLFFAVVIALIVGVLIGCATPRSKCGIPYTPEEDRAGIEHHCPEPKGAR